MDIDTANAVCRAIEALRPTLFTLENVRGYLNFTAFKNIMRTLRQLGYQITYDVLNAANFGVPQTRERLIVVARNDGKRPRMPEHTHARADLLGSMFETRLPRVGWYKAIEDLIAGLPDAQFANWQLARLPDVMREPVLVGGANTSETQAAAGVGVSSYAEPTRVVNATNSNQWRAFLVNESSTMEIRNADQPTATQVVSPSRGLKAFIVPGGNASSFDIREADAPARTVGDTERVGNAPRASIDGRVVKMTPRCLARFQSFPDSYVLPESARLATTGIGNAVPPLLMQRVLEANL